MKQSTKKAIAWSALDKSGQQMLLLLAGIVTMRLLDDRDFGLLAPLALFTGLANILSEGGLSAALIRKTDASEQDYSTVFWFNFLLGGLFYLLLWLAAPFIAAYNHAPELTLIARVQFLTVLFYSLGLIQSTHLIKQSDFKRLGIANVFSVALSSGVAVGMALSGCGYWALVGQTLTQAVSRTLLLWVLSRWMPRLTYSWASFRTMFGFSSKLILGNLANTFSANFYASVLGRYFPLGFYERAHKIKETGVGFMTHTFGQSIYLMLSQLQHETERFTQALRKSIRTVSFLLFPAMLGLAVVAPPLVEVVITDKWLPAVPYLRILCFSGILAVLNYMYSNALKVKGRSDITLILDVANALLLISFLFLSIRYGLRAAVLADACAKLIVFVAYGIAVSRGIGYRWRDQWRDVLPYAGLSAAMCALVWPLSHVIGNNWLLLAAQVGIGAGFYLGANKLLGSNVWEEVAVALKKRR